MNRSEESFLAHAEGFYQSRLQELTSLREAEGNPYLKRALSREMGKVRRALSLLSAFQGSPGSRREATDGRNFPGANLWRVLREALFLPLLGREVPRDLSPLKPILLGSWERWVSPEGATLQGSLGSHPGEGSVRRNVRFG